MGIDISEWNYLLYVGIFWIVDDSQSTDLVGSVSRYGSSNAMEEALERLQGVSHSNQLVAKVAIQAVYVVFSIFCAGKGILQINWTNKGRNKPQKRRQQQKREQEGWR